MTIHAFKDGADGYYQCEVPDGTPLPAWTEGLTPCAVRVESLADLKAARNSYINEQRRKANLSTFGHSGKVFACDELSRSDIDGVNGEVALTGALPETFPGAWKAVDNTYLPIPDVPAWTAFYQAMVAQGAANFLHAQQLKAALAAATTPAQVAAIVW